MEILYILIGVVLGIIIGWLFSNNKNRKENSSMQSKLQEAELRRVTEVAETEKSRSIAEDRYQQSIRDYSIVDADLKTERIKSEELGKRISKAEVEYRNLLEKLNTQKAEVDELQKKFTTEFKNIANDILKSHSQEFTAANMKNIGDVLNPLKERIGEFEKKVNEAYEKEMRDKISLREEVKKLTELNHKISEDANNLTKALKGDSKKQGNWGELVLDKIMERSGLTQGNEYETQYSTTSEDGKRIQPDVVVFLPDKKHIIIDSKVSLVAYENFVNAAEEEEKQKFLKDHIASIRTHIKGLSEKNYSSSKDLNSPDFVLLFIPIESSFGVAVQQDQQLFNFAWDNRIVIVTPSTLLATLKTISSIWKQENQTRNAIEIARQGGALYDKFVGFVNDLEKIGGGIEQLHKTYDDAMNKLHLGTGSLVSRAENIKKLGAKASKNLPDKYNSESHEKNLSENS